MLSQSELVRLATAQAREIVAAAEQDSRPCASARTSTRME